MSSSEKSRNEAAAHKARKTSVARAHRGPAAMQEAAANQRKKNPIHSLVTTLPVIMLLAGLGFYFFNERKQMAGEPILSQVVSYSGEYSGISKQGDSTTSQRLLWIETGERLRGARIDYAQYQKLTAVSGKPQMTVWAAPRVDGSATRWVVKLLSDDVVLLGESIRLPPGDTATTDKQ